MFSALQPLLANLASLTIALVNNTDGTITVQTAKLCAELVEDDELVIHDKTSARDIIGQSDLCCQSKSPTG